MIMDSGWICCHRELKNWEWYKTPFMVHLFMHLMLSANHQEGTWQGVFIQRGQLITGRKSLSADTGLSEQVVRTCLKRLEKTGEITQQSTNKFTIITVCNYDKYQTTNNAINQQPNQELTSNQPAINQQSTTNNNDNNETMKQVKNSRAKAFMPPTVDEVAAYCSERGNNIDAEYFVDKYTGNGWMVGKNKMKCWKATIRTWEKNNFEKRPAQQQRERPKSQKEQQALELLGYGDFNP